MKTSMETPPEPMIHIIEPPRLSGVRSKAVEITAELPADLSHDTVIVNATNMQAYAQGFIDELCKQIAEVRQAKQLVFVAVNDRAKANAERSANLRNFSEKLSFREIM